jgi:hypothetical protein
MTVSGLAGRMKSELAALARRHNVPPPVPITVPPVVTSMDDVVVEGFAATKNMPLDRVRLRPWCIPILPWKQDNPATPLLYKHDENQIAGTIERLAYDEQGQLYVRATVTHPFAKTCGAFSISLQIVKYELRDVDDPQNFHALVYQGELAEVSLTDQPADLTALVLQRSRPLAGVKSYDTIQKQLAHVQALVAALPAHVFAAAPQREPSSPRREVTPQDRIRLAAIHERAARRYYASISLPASTSSFSTMAAELNRRLEA